MKSNAKPINSERSITGVMNVTADMGDALATEFFKKRDLKTAAASVSAYRTAISGGKEKMKYQKELRAGNITSPIPFLEG